MRPSSAAQSSCSTLLHAACYNVWPYAHLALFGYIDELTDTAFTISVLLYVGPASEKFPVVVTSYEIVIADSKLLQRYTWKYVIVDEGHRLKNFNCKLLRELRQIPVDNKLLLTGVAHSVYATACIALACNPLVA